MQYVLWEKINMLKVITWQNFMKETSSKRVISFGAGKRFTDITKLPGGDVVINNTDVVIDNDVAKQGKLLEINGKTFHVDSSDALFTNDIDKSVILITIANGYYAIVEQLKQMGLYNKVDIYCLTHMLILMHEQEAMEKEIPENLRLSDTMLIPKTIHYCWFGGSPIPDKYKNWMESWKKFCPDYEIIEWNENNYDVTKNKYMYDAYKAKKWGFVPDYARLDIIYNYGGIYLDTDVELVDSLDELLYQKGFVGFESNRHVNFGSGFGAQRGNKTIKSLMEDYNKREFSTEYGMIPSPAIQTEVLKEKGLKINGEYQILDDITIYPEKMLSGKSLSSRRIILKDYTRAIHHFDGSWLESETKDYLKQVETEFNRILPSIPK